jgi:chromosome segregation ATPase
VEHQLKRRIGELEGALKQAQAGGAQAARPAADPAELAALKAQLAKVSGELGDLREENDFLNAEVARYTQKNRELSAKLGSK